MTKFRKKPIVIEAVQYKNLNKFEVEAFVGKTLKRELESETAYEAGVAPPVFSLIIETLEGDHKAMPGDYIIKGVAGEFYPCKPDIFMQTYERVEDTTEDVESTKDELLKEASKLIGHPATNISGSVDVACMEWREKYESFIQK